VRCVSIAARAQLPTAVLPADTPECRPDTGAYEELHQGQGDPGFQNGMYQQQCQKGTKGNHDRRRIACSALCCQALRFLTLAQQLHACSRMPRERT
jgi:hypothetical protein